MKSILLIASICLPFLVVVLFWTSASLFFRFHSAVRKDHPTIFKIIGDGEKYLEDPKAWIRHYRLCVTLKVIMMTAVLVSCLIGMSE